MVGEKLPFWVVNLILIIPLLVQLPNPLIVSLSGIKGFDKEAFEAIHSSGKQVTSIRMNPSKAIMDHEWRTGDGEAAFSFPIPWTDYGSYLSRRPSFTFDPLFHAGCYYVQEASSMFLEQAIKQTTDTSRSLRVLDLCAAPGGKSTHLLSLINSNSLLVSNDAIRSRANILKENIIKWGYSNVVVTNNDPKDFTQLENYFDVIVVDAPCSGSGLFRREPEAMEEWSLNNVELCSQRQQRILADVWPALKKNGILIYSTCSYSKEEDEDILGWMLEGLEVGGWRIALKEEWNIIEVESGGGYGYRFWPDKVNGEGFFISVFKKKDGDDEPVIKIKNKAERLTGKESEIVRKWVSNAPMEFIRHENTVYGWPVELLNDFNWLLNQLRVIYSGTIIGELVRDKLIPSHALALSGLADETIRRMVVNYDQAIDYLKKKDIRLESTGIGWQLVNYEGYSLGWINVLPNRINNYYPKEMRILKDR